MDNLSFSFGQVRPVRARGWVRPAVGLLLGAVALGWAVRGLDGPALQRSLAAISPLWVGLGLAGVVGVALAKAARWGALYPAGAARPRFGQLFTALVAAQMINLLLPIRLGELVRLVLMKQAGQPATTTLSTIVVEKVLDLLAAGLVAVALVALAAAPVWLGQAAAPLLLAGLSLAGGLLLIWWQRARLVQGLAGLLARLSWLPAGWQRRLLDGLPRLLAALGPLADRRMLAGVLVWSSLIWLLSLLTMAALLAAFGLQLPLTAAVLLVLAVSSSNIAPSPPALIGLIPGLAVLVLDQYGVVQATALGFGIVLNLVAVLPLILLGSWAWWSSSLPLLAWLPRRTDPPEGWR